MRILLSNDDGVHAAGLRALYQELRKLGDVCVVAPLEEKSTTGHSLTLHKPLRLIPIEGKSARSTGRSGARKIRPFYAVSGSPADCVYLGIREVMDGLPDLVVSGINRGSNLGQDVYYSGTVSAAREACILGIPAMAVSLSIDFSKGQSEQELHYETAAKIALQIARAMPSLTIPRHTLLNLNVPDVAMAQIKGIRVSRQGFRFYGGSILRRRDHRGKDYYWVGGQYKGFHPEEGTDCATVEAGYASLTPIKLDSTDLACMAALSGAASNVWPGKKTRAKSSAKRSKKRAIKAVRR